jgi:MoxR-like ATPase
VAATSVEVAAESPGGIPPSVSARCGVHRASTFRSSGSRLRRILRLSHYFAVRVRNRNSLSINCLYQVRRDRAEDFFPSPPRTLRMTQVNLTAKKIVANVEKVVIGKRQEVLLALTAWLCEGHILLEDVPGVAKTMLARALAASVGCSFKRVQCTPDLLPTDITGASIFNPKTTEFEFRAGPLFAQTVLADEINRTTPRTQAALLEAMAERRVTVDGVTYELERPFLVIATQNPVDHEGTFPLPEAQLDRFLVRLSLGYPEEEEERRMLELLRKEHPIDRLDAVVSAAEMIACQQAVREVYVDPKVRDYIVQLIRNTREHPDIALGGSPRASMALYRAAQARAAIRDHDFVLPDDVKRVAQAVLSHRLIVRPESRLRKITAASVVTEILEETSIPTVSSTAGAS